MQWSDVVDPSELTPANTSVVADLTDINLPLKDVCFMKRRAAMGFFAFTAITFFCLSFVIFGTSAQSLTGLLAMCGVRKPRAATAAADGPDSLRREDVGTRNSIAVDSQGRSMPVKTLKTGTDRLKGQLLLFASTPLRPWPLLTFRASRPWPFLTFRASRPSPVPALLFPLTSGVLLPAFDSLLDDHPLHSPLLHLRATLQPYRHPILHERWRAGLLAGRVRQGRHGRSQSPRPLVRAAPAGRRREVGARVLCDVGGPRF